MEKQLEEFLKGRINGMRFEDFSITISNRKVIISIKGSPRHYTLHLGGNSGFSDLHSKWEKRETHKTLIQIPRRQMFRYLIEISREFETLIKKSFQILTPEAVEKGPFIISRMDSESPMAKIELFTKRKKKIGFDLEKLNELNCDSRLLESQFLSCEKFVSEAILVGEVLHPESMEQLGVLKKFYAEETTRYLFLNRKSFDSMQITTMKLIGEVIEKYSVINPKVWKRFLSRLDRPGIKPLIAEISGKI